MMRKHTLRNKNQCYSNKLAKIHHHHRLRRHRPPHHLRQPLHLPLTNSPSLSLSVHTHHQLPLNIIILIVMIVITIITPILLLFYHHHHWQRLTYLRRMISSSTATSFLFTSYLLSLSPLVPPQTQWTVIPSLATSCMTQPTPSETPASTATTKPPSPISKRLRSPLAIKIDQSPNLFHSLVYPNGKRGVMKREKEMKIKIEREITTRS